MKKLKKIRIIIEDNPIKKRSITRVYEPDFGPITCLQYLIANNELILKKEPTINSWYKPVSFKELTKNELSDYLTLVDETDLLITEKRGKEITDLLNIEFKTNIYKTIINAYQEKPTTELMKTYSNLNNQGDAKKYLRTKIEQTGNEKLKELERRIEEKHQVKIKETIKQKIKRIITKKPNETYKIML